MTMRVPVQTGAAPSGPQMIREKRGHDNAAINVQAGRRQFQDIQEYRLDTAVKQIGGKDKVKALFAVLG